VETSYAGRAATRRRLGNLCRDNRSRLPTDALGAAAEKDLRRYRLQRGLIEHYLLPALYPSWLSLPVQYVLAGVVLLANILIYAWLWRRRVAQSRHLRR